MRRLVPLLIGLALTLGACDQPAADQPGEAEDFSPYGRWRIVSVNGAEAVGSAGMDAVPAVTFAPSSYGGSSGCNSFGGTGVWDGTHWYGDWPVATEMACTDVADQESSLMAVLASGPRIEALGTGGAVVESAVGRLVLARMEAPGSERLEERPPLMAGSRWTIRGVDGQAMTPETHTLAFDAEVWRVESSCGVSEGRWEQVDNVLTLTVERAPDACAEEPAHLTLAAMARGAARLAVGGNGELVLGGNGRWLLGWALEDDFAATEAAMEGEWVVRRVDDKPVADSPDTPRLTLAANTFQLFDGCNRTEGLVLARRGQLFTAGSGLSTLVACTPDADRARIAGIVGGQPRIAQDDAGFMVLVDRSGELTLERIGPAGAFSAEARPSTTLKPGMVIDILPLGRLTLTSARRFVFETDCARIEGDWRARQPARFSSEPPRAKAKACDTGDQSAPVQANRLLNGDLHTLIDANGERVLMVNDREARVGRLIR
ncbi:MAG: META domain-containing protein [Alphaproteobacteria bacterium]|nr:META domain-containing protein [Alphaproteobacteria bacterium]